MNCIAVRRENRCRWRRCAALVPDDVVELVAGDIPVRVQRSAERVFKDQAYETAGGALRNSLDDARVVLGVGQPAPECIDRSRVWLFASQAAGGLPRAARVARRIVDTGGTLIDWELLADDQGHRLVQPDPHLGHVAAIRTLFAAAERWASAGVATPLSQLAEAQEYVTVDEALFDLRAISDAIEDQGLPERLTPLCVAVIGDGAVSRGVQRVLDALQVKWHPFEEVVESGAEFAPNALHATVVDGRHLASDGLFARSPRQLVRSVLKNARVVIAAEHWSEGPVTAIRNAELRHLAETGVLAAEVIGDVTRGVDAAVEPTRIPGVGTPISLYDPVEAKPIGDARAQTVTIATVPVLPDNFAIAVSHQISGVLKKFAPPICTADLEAPSPADSGLPRVLQRACILWRGQLTDSFDHLGKSLAQYGAMP